MGSGKMDKNLVPSTKIYNLLQLTKIKLLDFDYLMQAFIGACRKTGTQDPSGTLGKPGP